MPPTSFSYLGEEDEDEDDDKTTENFRVTSMRREGKTSIDEQFFRYELGHFSTYLLDREIFSWLGAKSIHVFILLYQTQLYKLGRFDIRTKNT